MHVLQRDLPFESPLFDLFVDLLQSGYDAGTFLRADDADGAEHVGMGDGAHDVVVLQASVETDLCG